MQIRKEDLIRELVFRTSRSGGKGGQHVNKVSSKVELNFNVRNSGLFTDQQKVLIIEKLAGRINSDGVLQVVTEEERSQYRNKERGIEKLLLILQNALYRPALRKPTKPKRADVENRLRAKQLNALKKISRRDFFKD
ncbi:alternative ribosome rescue aminoacyl-tRNA hydrolase ArfB [Daejeonella sp. H1SJ63]|uniref:alternative ribosome rescue aminoacyl-tRNA hydrolase ArfB n=1 Tax=Daejeonella sp. H1SJ63 TaxID=3034145 RepID=UPI0023EAA461|nr:alternative ribosome rescue aminoacyl-tRNA hydrolase ArfB [Daejeonella sp. H1SJ63]